MSSPAPPPRRRGVFEPDVGSAPVDDRGFPRRPVGARANRRMRQLLVQRASLVVGAAPPGARPRPRARPGGVVAGLEEADLPGVRWVSAATVSVLFRHFGVGRPSETVFVGPDDHRVRRSCSGQVARFRRYRFGEEPEEHRPKTEADQIVQLLAERVGHPPRRVRGRYARLAAELERLGSTRYEAAIAVAALFVELPGFGAAERAALMRRPLDEQVRYVAQHEVRVGDPDALERRLRRYAETAAAPDYAAAARGNDSLFHALALGFRDVEQLGDMYRSVPRLRRMAAHVSGLTECALWEAQVATDAPRHAAVHLVAVDSLVRDAEAAVRAAEPGFQLHDAQDDLARVTGQQREARRFRDALLGSAMPTAAARLRQDRAWMTGEEPSAAPTAPEVRRLAGGALARWHEEHPRAPPGAAPGDAALLGMDDAALTDAFGESAARLCADGEPCVGGGMWALVALSRGQPAVAYAVVQGTALDVVVRAGHVVVQTESDVAVVQQRYLGGTVPAGGPTVEVGSLLARHPGLPPLAVVVFLHVDAPESDFFAQGAAAGLDVADRSCFRPLRRRLGARDRTMLGGEWSLLVPAGWPHGKFAAVRQEDLGSFMLGGTDAHPLRLPAPFDALLELPVRAHAGRVPAVPLPAVPLADAVRAQVARLDKTELATSGACGLRVFAGVERSLVGSGAGWLPVALPAGMLQDLCGLPTRLMPLSSPEDLLRYAACVWADAASIPAGALLQAFVTACLPTDVYLLPETRRAPGAEMLRRLALHVPSAPQHDAFTLPLQNGADRLLGTRHADGTDPPHARPFGWASLAHLQIALRVMPAVAAVVMDASSSAVYVGHAGRLALTGWPGGPAHLRNRLDLGDGDTSPFSEDGAYPALSDEQLVLRSHPTPGRRNQAVRAVLLFLCTPVGELVLVYPGATPASATPWIWDPDALGPTAALALADAGLELTQAPFGDGAAQPLTLLCRRATARDQYGACRGSADDLVGFVLQSPPPERPLAHHAGIFSTRHAVATPLFRLFWGAFREPPQDPRAPRPVRVPALPDGTPLLGVRITGPDVAA